jgi:hypothetical protein
LPRGAGVPVRWLTRKSTDTRGYPPAPRGAGRGWRGALVLRRQRIEEARHSAQLNSSSSSCIRRRTGTVMAWRRAARPVVIRSADAHEAQHRHGQSPGLGRLRGRRSLWTAPVAHRAVADGHGGRRRARTIVTMCPRRCPPTLPLGPERSPATLPDLTAAVRPVDGQLAEAINTPTRCLASHGRGAGGGRPDARRGPGHTNGEPGRGFRRQHAAVTGRPSRSSVSSRWTSPEIRAAGEGQ